MKMAANTAITIDVLFDHKIEGQELIKVMKEGFKHLLFIRRQLPLPYMLLEREQRLLVQQEQDNPKQGLGRGVQSRKREAAVTAVKDTTDAIDDFAISKNIHAMAVLIGSTVVSPKEIFLLRPEFKNLQSKMDDRENQQLLLLGENNVSFAKQIDKSGRFFIRNLVTNKDLSSLGDTRPTNVFFFVLAPRDSSDDSKHDTTILPKQSYRLPNKGKYYDIVLTDRDAINNSPSADKHPIDKINDIQQRLDLIWYQTKTVFKGYKESKSTVF